MEKIQVYLPEGIQAMAHTIAKKKNITVSCYIRKLILKDIGIDPEKVKLPKEYSYRYSKKGEKRW